MPKNNPAPRRTPRDKTIKTQTAPRRIFRRGAVFLIITKHLQSQNPQRSEHSPDVYDEKGKDGFTSPVKPFYDHSNLALSRATHGFREINSVQIPARNGKTIAIPVLGEHRAGYYGQEQGGYPRGCRKT